MRPSRRVLSLFVLMFLVPAIGQSAEKGKPVHTDVIEHQDLRFSSSDESLKLDLFLPRETTGSVPCVVVIQGGGFMAVDGKRFRPFAVYLAEHGYAAALIAYRGRPDHKYDATIADCKAAVRYVRSVADQYRIDPDRIGAMGRSAGGTLAAMLAVTGGEDDWEGKGGQPEASSRIQAAACFAGVFDFPSRFSDKDQLALMNDVDSRKKNNFEWIGEAYAPDNALWKKVSPVHHVDKSDPPMLLLHCKNDPTVPWLQTRDMAAKLKANGVVCEVVYYPTGGHGFRLEDAEAPLREMVKFFDQHLKAQKEAPKDETDAE